MRNAQIYRQIRGNAFLDLLHAPIHVSVLHRVRSFSIGVVVIAGGCGIIGGGGVRECNHELLERDIPGALRVQRREDLVRGCAL